MIKFKITTDSTPRERKPLPNEVGRISQSMNLVVETTIKEFADMMEAGYTWSAGIFEGNKRKNDNWLQQQILAFDFDNGITPNEIVDRLDVYGLTPNMIYTSFSDTPQHRKFRLILLLSEPLTDKEERDYIQRGLMEVIGDIDIACKDAARLYYGGKQSMILSNTPLHKQQILDVVNIENTKKFTKQKKSFTPMSGKGETLLYTNRIPRFSDKVEKVDIARVSSIIRIFNDFLEGVWLTHPQLFGLATSLIWIKGGAKLMKETMIKFNKEGKTSYTENNFSILPYVKKMNYQPTRLKSYSPYEEDWEHLNLITSVRQPQGFVEKIKNTPKITLEEAEKLMQNKFNEILTKNDNDIHILKLPTGIGKTRMLETVPFTLALPTNDLKDEVYDRVVVKKVKTPTFPELEDKELQEKINHLYKIGLDKVAIKLIIKIAKGDSSDLDRKLNPIDVYNCDNYLNDLRYAYASNDCVVTTHLRAIYSDFKSDTIVFDEDPLQTLLQVKSFNIADLINLESHDVEGMSDLINVLRILPKGVLSETPQVMVDLETLVKKYNGEMLSDVISMLKSDYLIKDSNNANIFHYVAKKDLPKNKKIIIMSATVPTEIYKMIYGDRVKITDVTNVQQTGKVIQLTKKSCSRSSLRSNMSGLLDKINTNLPSITFKDFIKKIPNAVENMYFGNVAGYDELKGKDINIIGTPHINNVVYMLIGKVIGLNLKIDDFQISYRMIQWGDYKFKFNCYDNDDLMSIQLSLIESELIQAVGRNRTLREDCTAYVYSNLPLSVATEIKI